jgi:hypothetical protein
MRNMTTHSSCLTAIILASASCGLEPDGADSDVATSTTEQHATAQPAASSATKAILVSAASAALNPAIVKGLNFLFPSIKPDLSKQSVNDIAAAVGTKVRSEFVTFIQGSANSLFLATSQYAPPCDPDGTSNCQDSIILSRQDQVTSVLSKANEAIGFATSPGYYNDRPQLAATLVSALVAQANFLVERHVLTKIQGQPFKQRRPRDTYYQHFTQTEIDNQTSTLRISCDAAKAAQATMDALAEQIRDLETGWVAPQSFCRGIKIHGQCPTALREYCWFGPNAKKDPTQAGCSKVLSNARGAYEAALATARQKRLESVVDWPAYSKTRDQFAARGLCEPTTALSTTTKCWAKNSTVLQRGNASLVFQVDGNVVLYQGGVPKWHLNSTWKDAYQFCMYRSGLYVQSDQGEKRFRKYFAEAASLSLSPPQLTRPNPWRPSVLGPPTLVFRDSAGREVARW